MLGSEAKQRVAFVQMRVDPRDMFASDPSPRYERPAATSKRQGCTRRSFFCSGAFLAVPAGAF
jgi:hypothetical protein